MVNLEKVDVDRNKVNQKNFPIIQTSFLELSYFSLIFYGINTKKFDLPLGNNSATLLCWGQEWSMNKCIDPRNEAAEIIIGGSAPIYIIKWYTEGDDYFFLLNYQQFYELNPDYSNINEQSIAIFTIDNDGNMKTFYILAKDKRECSLENNKCADYSKFNIKEKKVYRRDIKSKDLGGKKLKLKL